MSEHGQIINSEYDPSKNHIFEAFTEYFNNPVLTKIKNVDNYSMYLTKIHTLIGNTCRYLILFVNKDTNFIGYKMNMDKMEWLSLQTRTLEEHYDVKTHTYIVRKTKELMKKINIQSQNETQSTYTVESFPLIISILHTRKNNSYQYQSTGTIISALETFQTIINFK